MVRKVITGGQTGTEQAAWASARKAGVATGGYMPARFGTEAGPNSRLGLLYGAVEFPFDDARRARANLKHSDALLWLGSPDAPRARDLFDACREAGKPFLTATPGVTSAADVISWIDVFDVGTLMVSGPSESEERGIGPRVGTLMDRVLHSDRGDRRRVFTGG